MKLEAAVERATDWQEFRGFGGSLLCPDDDGYEFARRVHNGMIDKRPKVIAVCRGAADVAAAVTAATARGLQISVRGGGHNIAGLAVTDGGMMIDLSAMRGIYVDPANEVAIAQGGGTWGELNRETQLHGLAVTGGLVSSTGIAGLTLGGGLGWLMPRFGLAADNLIGAQVVLADGRVVTADATNNADLYWALRGGGGNFGVVTSFSYKVHKVGPMVHGGLVMYPYSDAAEVVRFYRSYVAASPDRLLAFCSLAHLPDGSGTKVVGILVCDTGNEEEARQDLAPLLGFGSPMDSSVGDISYSDMNGLIDTAFPRGAYGYWKSSFVESLSDELIDAMLVGFSESPSDLNGILFEHFHGEVTRVDPKATAFAHRQEGFNLILTGIWLGAENTEANVAWTRNMYRLALPYTTDRRYSNYLDADDLAQDPGHSAYGDNYDRLRVVKDKYDPNNAFHLNTNILPT